MIDFFRKILGQKLINYYHLIQAVLANFVYGFPSRKLHVIGVTGTDGKTTTANFIAGILKEARLPISFLTTINAQIGDPASTSRGEAGKSYDTGLHTTTPSSFLLQRLLRRMVSAGSKYAVLEVTSHALDQYRTWGIDFETAVITNISHEHLDYHKDLESYMRAKAKLLRGAKNIILNADDKSFEYLHNSPSPPLTLRGGEGELVAYGLNPKAAVWADQIEESLTETKFTAHALSESFPVNLNLPGKFNAYNALAAIAATVNYNVSPEAIQKGLMGVKGIKGRLEMIEDQVMVDFAHTPNAIEKLMEFLRPKIKGRIIHVFGSAGERDQTKRPLMGEAADKFADIIVLTREDNRSEEVNDICEQIVKGIKRKKRDEGYFVIPDRREAIRFALKKAQAGDLVVVSGKGHEQSLNVDGKEMPWDDRKVTAELLNQLSSRTRSGIQN